MISTSSKMKGEETTKKKKSKIKESLWLMLKFIKEIYFWAKFNIYLWVQHNLACPWLWLDFGSTFAPSSAPTATCTPKLCWAQTQLTKAIISPYYQTRNFLSVLLDMHRLHIDWSRSHLCICVQVAVSTDTTLTLFSWLYRVC